MKHLVRINDDTPEGAGILEVLKKLPGKTVEFVEEEENLDDCVPIEVWADELREGLKKVYSKKEKDNS